VKIDHQAIGTVQVLSPYGALVDEDAEAFCKELTELIDCPSPRIVVSLADVPYMDSAALEGLWAAADELANRASGLKLANVSPTCREILELTGLSRRFRFFEDVRDAAKSFM